MGKFKVKELLDLNTGKSNLQLHDLFFASEDMVDLREMNLIAEGMSNEGIGFEIRGIALEGKWGCVDCKQQRAAVKGSRGIHDQGSHPKRRRTSEPYKLRKIVSEPIVDSENLSKRAVVVVEGKWGCVDCKQQTVAVKGSRGIGDHEKMGVVGSHPKRKRTLKPCKLQKIVSESTVDSEDLSRRAVVAVEGKFGCVDCKQQRVAVKGSRGIDDHEKMGLVGSRPKRKTTLEPYKLQKKVSESTVDSENLSKRAVLAVEGKWDCVNSKQQTVAVKVAYGGDGVTGNAHEIGEKGLKKERNLQPCKLAQRDLENLNKRAEKCRVLGRRAAHFEVRIGVAKEVSYQPISQKKVFLPNKICEGTVELANKETGTGSFANDFHPKASTSSNVDSEDSTRKALRAEMIKARFADTIRKAQEQKILMEGNMVEKKRLERRKANTGCFANDSHPKASTSSNVDSENSTRKALWAEMIEARFADTVRKAQEQKILMEGNMVEKRRLERRKANTEADIRATECKLKEQRQKEREAARIAVENMGRTVDWNHALEVTLEFEKLGVQCSVDRTPFARDRFCW